MSTLIIILAILAGYHYFIESIVLNVFRFTVRCKLIKLKDDLILLKIGDSDAINYKAFNELQMVIVSLASNLEDLSLYELYKYRNKIHHHEHFKNEESMNFFEVFNDQKTPKIKRIFDKSMKYAFLGFLINSGSWILYLMPFIIIAGLLVLCVKGYEKLKSFFFGTVESKKAILVIAEKYPSNNDDCNQGEAYSLLSHKKTRNSPMQFA